jgi:hypothetical protein
MLPWNSIQRLRDHFGDYVLVVTCRSCGHAKEMTPSQLVSRCRGGWDEPIATLVDRFRCGCGALRAEVQIGFNRKPRGWSKNPS